jgi:hypothetical protein
MDGGEALFPLAGQVFPVLTIPMTKPPEIQPGDVVLPQEPSDRSDEQIAKTKRAARLAAALRDNLRRRKAARPERRDS